RVENGPVLMFVSAFCVLVIVLGVSGFGVAFEGGAGSQSSAFRWVWAHGDALDSTRRGFAREIP
ncbi:MAG: hypothetical protein WCC31_12915, partial [Terracidiphilus sp.]